MNIIKGKLEAFFETGTEGVVWSVYEDGKTGYDGLNCLKPGDSLQVLDPVTKEIIWSGNINLEYKRRWRPYPLNPQYGQQEVFGFWVHGFQVDLDPEMWAMWFFEEYPAEMVRYEKSPDSELGN